MAEPMATVADIEARWRSLSEDEAAVAEVLLVDAEVLLNARLPALAAAVTAETVPVALVVQVIAGMVKRVLTNPDALRSLSVGSFSESYAETPDLQPTSAELSLLLTAIRGTASAGTVRSVALRSSARAAWVAWEEQWD